MSENSSSVDQSTPDTTLPPAPAPDTTLSDGTQRQDSDPAPANVTGPVTSATVQARIKFPTSRGDIYKVVEGTPKEHLPTLKRFAEDVIQFVNERWARGE